MKIIEANNSIKCPCGCTFEYDAKDVKWDYFKQGGFFLKDLYRKNYVMCPICNQMHVINSKFIGKC